MRRICGSVILALIVLVAGRAFAAGDDSIEFQSSVEYSNPHGEHLKLDLAQPKPIDGLAPAVVCIHGGGWAGGGREGWDDVCKQLAARGYVAITVTYRLAPKYVFPAQIDDVKAAVRWLRANAERLKVDPNRIGAVGDSAGGHLRCSSAQPATCRSSTAKWKTPRSRAACSASSITMVPPI